MKKEKLFKIGIINESTIDVVKDMTTFYTSDTELWLGFELSEEGVEFDSVEILLFNIDDKSFVVRSVVKTDDKYWYELDMDMIAHHGQWEAQLQFTKNNEIYTSKHFDFRIENDLSNERPPKLIDITNWSNIKQAADSLIAEMKVAVTEAIEAEQNRAEIFFQDESERQTTFETNESERTETFKINETTRQAQELERENAEANRQSVFDGNEANRTEAFKTNEATRIANEEARELAENERENAEAQRKIDHANRSAELASKADKVVLKNLTSPPTQVPYAKDFEGYTSDVWYASVEARYIQYNSGRTRLTLRNYGNSNNPTLVEFKSQVSENFEYYSVQASGKINGTRLIMSSDLSPDLEIDVRNLIALNLTETFGTGNEPTKEEMDELIKVIGYIDGEYALNNKELLMWTISLVRSNRNAIIALGGTI